jgi:short subunit fatty acids transporter
MAVMQIADIIVPAQFSEYILEESMVSTALYESGLIVKNSLMAAQLAKGSNNFTIPFWADPAGSGEADITSDDP